MEVTGLSKKVLIELIETAKKVLEGASINIENRVQGNDSFETDKQSDLENLIGSIPFLLLNKDIFEKNQDIADFAKKLNIDIPSPEKKKREDMIGRIVSAIASFNDKKISELNLAIKSVKKSDIKKGKSNFFKDWELAIKQMQL